MSLVTSAIVLILGSVGLSIFGLWLFRTHLNVRSLKKEEAVVGFLFNAVGLIYAVVLAFVVFAVWQRYSVTEEVVINEASALVVAFRNTQNLPEPAKTQAQQAYIDYAHFVMNREWTSHGAVIQHRTPDPLNKVWNIYRNLQPSPDDSPLIGTAAESLHELENQRHLRHLAGAASLPWVFWPLLIGGGAITVVFSYFFVMKSFLSQGLLTGLLAAVIAGVLFLIFVLNYPFTGQVQVSKDPFRHALEQFKALNLK